VDRIGRNDELEFVRSVDDFCFSLINDGRSFIDQDGLMSISLDFILFILGGNDKGRVGRCEMSMKGDSIIDSGILISNPFVISSFETIRKSLLVYHEFSYFVGRMDICLDENDADRFFLQITIISCGKSYSINEFESPGSSACKRVIKYVGMRPFS